MPGITENYQVPRDINPIISKDDIDVYRDPLTFDLDDQTFLQYAKTLKREADDYWNDSGEDGYNLSKRRSKNERYYFGRQLNGVKLKKYNSRAQDNIIYEAEQYLRAMATSKMPDITVKPGGDSDEQKKLAEDLSKIVTSDIQSRERKRVLGLAFKHLPVYFTGIIKAFWNPQKGKYGNYDFKAVHPGNVTLDFRSSTNDPRDMTFIFETCEYTVKELIMMFPDKKKELFEELRKYSVFGDVGDPSSKNENNEKGLNTKIKIEEVWFKWFDKPKESEKDEFEEIIGVAWYFQGVLFKKIKHPYWDWSGTPQTFTYEYKEVEGSNLYSKEKTPIDEDKIKDSLLTNQKINNTETEYVFRNHLDYPEFPYIFLGMDQWGKTPLDETSRIEQTIPVQENYDVHNRQLTEMIQRSRGKNVWDTSQGLSKDDITNNDMSDPDQDMMVNGDVNKTHAFIPGEQPSPSLIQAIGDERERIFDKLGVHQATRGQINSDTAATNNQIAREGDFTRMDDLVDDTINYACEKIANWEMQLMKLFYTEDHFVRLLGKDGKWLTMKLHRDLLEDGMEIIISASGSDKLKAEQRAMDMAKMKLVDPFRFYTDVGASDPKGRTMALMNFLMTPDLYRQEIAAGGDGSRTTAGIQQSANVINGQTVSQGQQTDQQQQQSPQAMQDIMQIEQGQIPSIPQQIDQTYAQTFNSFMQSQEVEQLIQRFGDQFKQQLLQFAQAVAQMAQGQGQQQPQQTQKPSGVHPAVAPVGGGGQGAGPLAQNPSPQNTSQIAAIAGRG